MSQRCAVLLATYNGESYLSSQISSIRGQIGVTVDIYIRDDCSTDNTLNKLKDFLSDESINIITTDRSSGSPAGNFFKLLSSVNITEYDYIAFSDQDDVWFPEKLLSAVSSITENYADAYSSDLIPFNNEKPSAWYINKNVKQKKYDYLFQGASAGCTYVLNNSAASLILKVLGDLSYNFPKGHSHDWLIYAICRSHGLKWVHDNRAFIAYRQHSVNAFGAMPGARGLLRRLRLSKNRWYREQILWQGQFLSHLPGEARILEAVARLNLIDRLYLVSICWSLRRSRRDCALLSIVIIFGLI